MAYQDEFANDAELKESYWWITHVQKIRTAGMYAIGSAYLIWFAGIGTLAVFVFMIQHSADSGLAKTLPTQSSSLKAVLTPAELTIKDIGKLEGSGKTFDLYALVENPNKDWWATATFQFSVDDQPLAKRIINFYAGEQKYPLLLAQTIPSSSNIDLSIVSVSWQRMTKKDAVIFQERNRFSVSDIEFLPSRGTEDGFASPVTTVSFTVHNMSPFSFPEIIVPVIAKTADSIVALAQVSLFAVKAEEKRFVRVSWFHQFEQPTDFDIRPSTSLFYATSTKKL